MRNKLIGALILCLGLLGCGKECKKIDLEIVIFEKLPDLSPEKYNKPIQAISMPLEDLCKENNFGFAPFQIKRADLNKKVEIDYLNNKAGDDSKVRFVTKQLEHYYRDSSVSPALLEESNSSFSIDDYLQNIRSKKNYFVYSSDESFTIDSFKVFHSIEELRFAIGDLACKGEITKAYVLFEPKVIPTITKIVKPSNTQENCSQALQIIKQVQELAVLGFSEQKSGVDKVAGTYFTDDFKIVLRYEDSKTNVTKDFENGRDYLDQLASDKDVEDIQVSACQKNSDGKITLVEVVEIRKKDIDIQAK